MTVQRCRSCGAPVEWRLTPAGKRCPYDAGTDTSHFTTCPDARRWSRKPATWAPKTLRPGGEAFPPGGPDFPPAPPPEPAPPETERPLTRLEADPEALQRVFGPPQPRAPQRGQPALPLDGAPEP